MSSVSHSAKNVLAVNQRPEPADPAASPIEHAEAIEIIADDREAGQPVLQALRQIPQVRVSVQRLNVGDYQVGARLIIERKTAKDFVASIIDGRLFRQAAQLGRCSHEAFIILEGSGRDLAESGMSREAIQGALISLGLIFHLPVLRTLDPAESAHLMVFAWRQLVRQDRDQIVRSTRRPKQRKRAQLFALQGLPSIGPKRAEILLERFGSVRGVINASAAELSAIPGVKEKTVEAIEWVLG